MTTPLPHARRLQSLRPTRAVLRTVHARQKDRGRIAAIDPRSGKFVVEESLVVAAQLARRLLGPGPFYFVRIGAPAVHSQHGGFGRRARRHLIEAGTP